MIYEESLKISRGLVDELGTSASRRDLSVSLNNVGHMEEACEDLVSALKKYLEGLQIRRSLAEQLRTPESRRDVSASLDAVASVEWFQGNLDSAFARNVESLEILRLFLGQLDAEPYGFFGEFRWRLGECRDLGIRIAQFSLALPFANECWLEALSDTEGDPSPSASEVRLRELIHLMHCQTELRMQVEALDTRGIAPAIVDSLVRAFAGRARDRNEQNLNSMTLFHCADALELCTRMDEMRGAAEEARATKLRGAKLRARAEALKVKENACSR